MMMVVELVWSDRAESMLARVPLHTYTFVQLHDIVISH